jgi:hypothetical protein
MAFVVYLDALAEATATSANKIFKIVRWAKYNSRWVVSLGFFFVSHMPELLRNSNATANGGGIFLID